MHLPLQRIISQFTTVKEKKLNMGFAVDFLREKHNLVVSRETYYLTLSAHPSGNFSLFSNVSHMTGGAFKQVILDDNNEVVCVGPYNIPLLTHKTARHLEWTNTYAEDYIKGELIMIYDYKNKPFIATKSSPKAKNIVPEKKITYYAAVRNYLTGLFKQPVDVHNILYKFDPNFFYHLVYTHGLNKECLTLISAVHKEDLREVSDTRLSIMAAELNLTTPDYDMVISYTDALQYFNSIKHFKKAVIIKDGAKKFKLKGD